MTLEARTPLSAAADRLAAADEAFQDASRALRDLQCQAPMGGYDGECWLPAGHAGEVHSGSEELTEDAPAEYQLAHAQYVAARETVVEAHEEWFALLQTSEVTPEEFAAAQERWADALARYKVARAADRAAERLLSSLQCRTEFVVVVDGPGDDNDDDYYAIDEVCRRQSGHEGEHMPYEVPAETAPAAYRAAFAAAAEAGRRTGDLLYDWETAESELEALRCGHRTPEVWPCSARRGHEPATAHVHPTTLRLEL